MSLDALKRELDDAAGVGLDLSPGDPLAAKAVAAIRELQAEAERLQAENVLLEGSLHTERLQRMICLARMTPSRPALRAHRKAAQDYLNARRGVFMGHESQMQQRRRVLRETLLTVTDSEDA